MEDSRSYYVLLDDRLKSILAVRPAFVPIFSLEDMPEPFRPLHDPSTCILECRRLAKRLLSANLGDGVKLDTLVGRTLHDHDVCVHCGVGLGESVTLEEIAGHLHATHRGGRHGCLAFRTVGLEHCLSRIETAITDLARSCGDLNVSVEDLTKQMRREAKRGNRERLNSVEVPEFDFSEFDLSEDDHQEDITAYWRSARGRDSVDGHVAHQLRLLVRVNDFDTLKELIDIAVSRMQAADSDARVFKYVMGIVHRRMKQKTQGG